MNFTESQFCKFPRLVCISLGLWPYTYKRHRLRSLCVYFILISGVICQLLPLARCDHTTESLMVLSILVLPVAYVSKFHGYYFNMEKVRHVFDYIEDDWKSFTNEGELEIVMKYANRGKVLNLFMIGIFSTLVALFVAYPFVWMAWTNKTRPLQIPLHDEYDHDRYALWILLYIDVQVIVGTSTLVAVESATVICMFHLCGVFRIVRDRLAKTVASSVLNARNGNKYSPSVRKQLTAALKLHQRLLELIKYMNKSFSKHYFYMVFVGVAALTTNLYMVAVYLPLKKITQKMLNPFIVVCCSVFYLCCINYMGQKIIDKGNELFMSTLRCMKRCSFVSTIYFVASMECFFVLTNTAMSYFMMLRSVVQRP
ncbi:uncharacterized protein LOC143354650 isoform X2 [Halictus rubicundus]|uniref:uncharacterized protein LOC143354650 isoform X2 n=1 Tax=Halictus rubicundus TaxID=77578 RepID=UPI0040366D55